LTSAAPAKTTPAVTLAASPLSTATTTTPAQLYGVSTKKIPTALLNVLPINATSTPVIIFEKIFLIKNHSEKTWNGH
jgi:hypothetical protein